MDYNFYNALGYIFIILATVITLVSQYFVTSRYNKYKLVKTKKNMTGQEVARLILDKHGLNDVYVTEVSGSLTDHYDPNRRVVRLSTDIFHGDSIASVSVAAHEVGHAIQDKEGYSFIKIRGFIFPFVSFASKFGYIAIIIGLVFGALDFAWAGIGLLLFILLFQLITLPVEFNASRRALGELQEEKILDADEMVGSNNMLKAAAMTYVASVAATILEILRLVIIVSGRDDNR